MIPLELQLKNFLSYQQVQLDFRGLHTACVCGSNGAGKSSLLEAITWVVWGKTRIASDDDVIRAGSDDTRVQFEFISDQQTYRIIRHRRRGKTSTLDFQIQGEGGNFRALARKGLRETQKMVIEVLRLDYDTFTNSAYLRQGRADEFMLKGPQDRKKILADLLKLDQYETLSQKAHDAAKSFKARGEQLQQTLAPQRLQLEQRQPQKAALAQVLREIQQLQDSDRRDQQQLDLWKTAAVQRQTWVQQWQWHRDQQQTLREEGDRLAQEYHQCQNTLAQWQTYRDRREIITENYGQYQTLRQQEQSFGQKFDQYQALQQQQQALEKQLQQAENQLTITLNQQQAQRDLWRRQLAELQPLLDDEDAIAQGKAQLQAARTKLHHLDQLQSQYDPLVQQQQQIQRELERIKTQKLARLESLQTRSQELRQVLDLVPQQREQLQTMDAQVRTLENQKQYREHLRSKRAQQEQQQERLRVERTHCREKVAALQQKLQLLHQPEATCPVCHQDLSGELRQEIVAQTHTERTALEAQALLLEEELINCDRTLEQWAQEDRELARTLAPLDQLNRDFNYLEGKIDDALELQNQLNTIHGEITTLEGAIAMETYGDRLQQELNQLQEQIQALGYEPENHDLWRNEVNRLGKGELRYHQWETAKKQQQQLQAQLPPLEADIAETQRQRAQIRENSPQQQALDELRAQERALGYDRQGHSQIRDRLQQYQEATLDYQRLAEAEEKFPQTQGKLEHLGVRIAENQAQQQEIATKIITLETELEQHQDHHQEITQLEKTMGDRRSQLDQLLARQGTLQAQLEQLDHLEAQIQDSQDQLTYFARQARIYQELKTAFGKNGLQAYMIENVLPQLEAETNHILARLTGNQLHVQFVTQKAKKGGSKKKSNQQLIDTLDILISDAWGTRAYETYSGGEAFRINFSIRLALAKLLAQRAGTALQLLIVDEGFGTQDGDGCDKLIAAINAIADDFACILTVTHMQKFKEAFQTRIEVTKTEAGSQLTINS